MRRPFIPQLRTAAAVLAACALAVLVSAPVGAASAPNLVKNINPYGSSNPSELTRVGRTLFFAANDRVHGVELWKSDGTAAGTKMVRDIRSGAKGSAPMNLVNVAGLLFFTAQDGVHGRELWKSDGTRAGTVLVKDLFYGCPKGGYCSNGINMLYPPVAAGNRLFFVLQSGGVITPVLYVSDGTASGTHSVRSPYVAYDDVELGDRVAAAHAGRLYFVVSRDSDNAEEIWVTNGTRSGTHRMAGSPTSDVIRFLPAQGQNLYFLTGRDNTGGQQVPGRVWRTDGTSAGTKPITDAGELTSAPTDAALMDTRLYFSDDAALWRTNGTPKGTRPFSSGPASFLAGAGSTLFFSRGPELWTSDGTSAGTAALLGFNGLWPRQVVGVGSVACFAVQDWDVGTWQLFRSDGTNAGTYPVSAFVNPSATDAPGAPVEGTLFFAADDGMNGVELWSYTP